MSLAITEENRALQQLARDFAEQEIRPISAERDLISDPRGVFDWEIIEKGSKLGLRTLAVPEKFGGPGIDLMGQTLVILELARGDGGIAKTFSQCWKFSPFLTDVATDEQRERFLPPFMENDRFLLASGITEPNAGSDNRMRLEDPQTGLRLSVVRDGDVWVLDGMKHFIANGNVASLYIIRGRTNPAAPISRGVSMFLVSANTTGFRIGRTHNKVGFRFYQNAELIFEDCRIPAKNLLGEMNQGLGGSWNLTGGFNDIELPANILGIAQSAYEHAIDHAQNRVQGGRPIIEHQAIALKLADMYMRLEAARSYLFRVVESAQEEGVAMDSASKQLMKVFATESAQKVTRDAVEIFGGMGVMREAPVEKLMRDASVFTHLAADSVMRLKASERLP